MQTFKRLTERFWYQTPVSSTDRPVLAVVQGDERTLMIDAGNSKRHAELFLKEVKDAGIRNPDLLALTHWHWDHVFGLAHLDMPSIATGKTREEIAVMADYAWTDAALAERIKQGIEIKFCADAIKEEFGDDRDIAVALPAITFDGRLVIDLGGVTCVLQQVEGDHSPGCAVIHIPEERILFLGDAFYADIFAPKPNYTVERTRQLLQTLEQFDADHYVLSHGGPITKAEYAEEAKLLLRGADLAEAHGGSLKAMREAYSATYGELTEDAEETLVFFANGFSLKQV
ncbi:MBL fold metallo-hydrolase [Exiguobacterium flavidum]|uniref:MBL fold metallo-hydrolase n=1 Tax=Exiguobacterium flavidum TaxID=2184695 RepID=UPI000DF8381C|nr:MBL fold metallo-hydrolase [Exiguobacterium flavidum]